MSTAVARMMRIGLKRSGTSGTGSRLRPDTMDDVGSWVKAMRHAWLVVKNVLQTLTLRHRRRSARLHTIQQSLVFQGCNYGATQLKWKPEIFCHVGMQSELSAV